MNKITGTGMDATLGSYLKLAELLFGSDSGAVTFLREKIAESPHGESEEVIAAETQMMYLLGKLANEGYSGKEATK